MKLSQNPYLISRFIILLSVLIAFVLGFAIWNINPWPTDAEVYYMPAALRIPYIHYLSEIHITEGMINIRWLHGKEFYVAGISLFQFLLNDFESLRPLMMLGLISIAVSSILIFYISRRIWGQGIALWCYFAFTFCLWPYIYILFAKHQTLGLMFFLLAVALLLNISRERFRALWFFLSGLSVGLAIFSSTVSSLYVPYYAAAYLFLIAAIKVDNVLGNLKILLGSSLMIVAGFLTVFIYVNLPDIFLNLKNFAEYVHISGTFNHFYYNQPALQQWFAHINVAEVRGGWVWIFKYLLLILPVLFPIYLVAFSFLCWSLVKENSWRARIITAGIMLLSLSSLFIAETAKVAQYGANYFSVLPGIIILIAYASSVLVNSDQWKTLRIKNSLRQVFIVLLIIHGVINVFLFVSDVYIPRMVTTFLSDKIKSLGIDHLATYRMHFHRNNFTLSLEPQLREKLSWVGIQSIGQMPEGGYVLVPPATGDSIYAASASFYNNYDMDIVLVQLLRKNLIEKCSVASFRTIASSRIWQQEEEILSYRSLMLGHRFPEDKMGRVWLVDAKKAMDLAPQLMPNSDEMRLFQGGINNIGTSEKFYIFQGQRMGRNKKGKVSHFIGRIWAKGDPQDGLVATIFKIHPKEPIWLYAGKNATSQVLKAAQIKAAGENGVSIFTFDPPPELEKGLYYFTIYRTGKPSDQNYYQIDNKHFAIE